MTFAHRARESHHEPPAWVQRIVVLMLTPSAMSLYERLVAAVALRIDRRSDGGNDERSNERSNDAGLDPDDPSLAELVAAGFAELDGNPPIRAVAVPLPTALERALFTLQGQFLDQQRQLVEAREYFDALQLRFSGVQRGADPGVRLTGSFADLLADAVAAATSDVAGWNLELPAPATASIRVRTICDVEYAKRHGGVQWLRAGRAAGHEIRIAPELPTSTAIADRSTVVLDLDGPHDQGGTPSQGVAVGSALAVGAFLELFELLWRRAVPWLDRGESDKVLTPMEHRITALMAVGRTDEEIAAHLGMSVRTVRRHVAGVMDRLQAGTRFAAGVAAARAGLLDETDLRRAVPPNGF